MRIFRIGFALAGLSSFASAAILPRTIFERHARHRDLAAQPYKFDAANALTSMLDINEAGGSGLSKVLSMLVAQTPTLSADEESFNKFYETYFIMQQTPAFKDAVASGADFSDATVRSKVLTDSVANTVSMVSNLLGDALSKDATTGLTGTESKLASFLQSGDANVADLLQRNSEGDNNATPTLQQLFMNKHYGGLDIEALKNDDFMNAQREILQGDTIFNHYVDETTKDVLFDPALKFGDNLGHVDTFFTGDLE